MIKSMLVLIVSVVSLSALGIAIRPAQAANCEVPAVAYNGGWICPNGYWATPGRCYNLSCGWYTLPAVAYNGGWICPNGYWATPGRCYNLGYSWPSLPATAYNGGWICPNGYWAANDGRCYNISN